MSADAEIKLRFEARIEDAKARIAELKELLEEVGASGGIVSPDAAERIATLEEQLAGYTAKVKELEAAYLKLQERAGRMGAEMFGQAQEWKAQLEKSQEQIDALLKKIVDLQVEVNKLKDESRQVSKAVEDVGTSGQRSFRSLRGIIGNFITSLAKGKLEIKEMGIALKGLARASIILTAISYAMSLIEKAGERIKQAFKEDTKTAEDAAKAAQDAGRAAEVATKAAEQAGNALRDAAEEQSLRAQAEAVARSFQEQRDAARETVQAINDQAKAEARRRALAAREEDHEREMRRMELEIQLIDEKITQAEYRKQIAALEEEKAIAEARRNNTAAWAAESTANATVNTAMERAQTAGEDMRKRREALKGMKTPQEIDAIEKRLEQARAERDALRAQLDEATAKGEAQERIDELYQKWDEAANIAGDIYDELQRVGNTRAEYEFAVKAAEQAVKNYNDARNALQQANAELEQAHRNTEMTRQEGESSVNMAHDRRVKTEQVGEAKERAAQRKEDERRRKEQAQRDRRRDELQGRIATLERKGLDAASTPGTEDDRRFYDQLSSFLDRYGKQLEEYGVGTGRLISIVEKLRLANESTGNSVADLRRRIAELEKNVNRTRRAVEKNL